MCVCVCVCHAGYLRYLAADAFGPLWEEVLYVAPFKIVMLPMSPLLKFWTIPGWKAKGLAIVDVLTRHSCCVYARLALWRKAMFTLFGPVLGVAFVASCNATTQTFKFLQRSILSGASDIGGKVVDDMPRNKWQPLCSPIQSAWGLLRKIRVFRNNNTAVLAVPQEQGKFNKQQGTAANTEAEAQSPSTVELLTETEEVPSTAKAAANTRATAAADSTADKQATAAQHSDTVQSDLLKAHRAEPERSSRAAASGPMPNKRARKAARRAAKAAAAEGETEVNDEADTAAAPALLMTPLNNNAKVKGQAVKAAASALPTRHEEGDAAAEGEGFEAAAPVSLTADQADIAPTVVKQNKGGQVKDVPTGAWRMFALVMLKHGNMSAFQMTAGLAVSHSVSFNS